MRSKPPNNVSIERENPAQTEIEALFAEADAYFMNRYQGRAYHLLSADALNREKALFFVARANKDILGYAALLPQGDWGEVKRMFVRDNARGHGVGKRLLESIETQALGLGLKSLRLETGINQTEAHGLYSMSGFEERAPFGNYVEDEVSIFMEKVL